MAAAGGFQGEVEKRWGGEVPVGVASRTDRHDLRRVHAAGPMTKRSSASIALGLKLVVTTGLLVYLVRKVSIGPALAQMATMRPAAAIGAAILVLLQLALGSVRWQLISGLLQAPMHLGRAFKFTLIGQFFNQVLPTALGGDAVRAWLASRDGAPLGRAIRAVVCDRVVGLVALLIIISATLLVMPHFAERSLPLQHVFRTAAVLALAGLAALFFFGDPLARRLQRHRLAPPARRRCDVPVRERHEHPSRLRRRHVHRPGDCAGFDGTHLDRGLGRAGRGHGRRPGPVGHRRDRGVGRVGRLWALADRGGYPGRRALVCGRHRRYRGPARLGPIGSRHVVFSCFVRWPLPSAPWPPRPVPAISAPCWSGVC